MVKEIRLERKKKIIDASISKSDSQFNGEELRNLIDALRIVGHNKAIDLRENLLNRETTYASANILFKGEYSKQDVSDMKDIIHKQGFIAFIESYRGKF